LPNNKIVSALETSTITNIEVCARFSSMETSAIKRKL